MSSQVIISEEEKEIYLMDTYSPQDEEEEEDMKD